MYVCHVHLSLDKSMCLALLSEVLFSKISILLVYSFSSQRSLAHVSCVMSSNAVMGGHHFMK